MPTEIQQALKSLTGFGALEDSVLATLTAFSSTRVMRAGETIFCQGEPSPYCFGVLAGEIVIQYVPKDRRFAPKLLGVLRAGSLFGESSIFEDRPRAAMASAHKDGKLVAIRGSQLREWIYHNPAPGLPLLLAMLNASAARLRRTNHELAVIYNVERLLGSGNPFLERFSSALDFFKGSLGLDDLVFYQRSAGEEEFCPVMSFPSLTDLPSVSLQNELIDHVRATGRIQTFQPPAAAAILGALKLPWEDRASVALIPLGGQPDNPRDPFPGFIVLTSRLAADAFSPEKQILLMSVSQSFSDALARHRWQQDYQAP